MTRNPATCGQRPAQVPRSAQHRQDQHLAPGVPLAQLCRRGQPIGARQVDIDHGHIHPLAQRGRHNRGAVGDLGHHVDIVFQVQHGRQGVPQDLHVLGHQNPDHCRARTRHRWVRPRAGIGCHRCPPHPVRLPALPLLVQDPAAAANRAILSSVMPGWVHGSLAGPRRCHVNAKASPGHRQAGVRAHRRTTRRRRQ